MLFDGEDAAMQLAERARAEAAQGEEQADERDEKKDDETIMLEHILPATV